MRLFRRHPIATILVVGLLIVIVAIAASGVVVWRAAHHDDASQVRSPYDDCGPVLPGHVLALFEDGVEPFLVTDRR